MTLFDLGLSHANRMIGGRALLAGLTSRVGSCSDVVGLSAVEAPCGWSRRAPSSVGGLGRCVAAFVPKVAVSRLGSESSVVD